MALRVKKPEPITISQEAQARGSALLLAAAGGCGHPDRGDRVRRQADEEAPTDDGRREEGGFRADDSLLGRAQKESREVARRGRDEYVPVRGRSILLTADLPRSFPPRGVSGQASIPARPRGPRRGRTRRPPTAGATRGGTGSAAVPAAAPRAGSPSSRAYAGGRSALRWLEFASVAVGPLGVGVFGDK